MLRVTELACGLERQWNRRHLDARNVPWHVGVWVLALGIVCGARFCPALPEMPGWSGNALFLWGDLCVLVGLLGVMAGRVGCGRMASAGWIGVWLTCWCGVCFAMGMVFGSPREKPLPEVGEECEMLGEVVAMPPGVKHAEVVLNRWICGGQVSGGRVRVRMNLDVGRDGEWRRGMVFSTHGRFERYEGPEVPGMFDARMWALSQGLDGRFDRLRVRGEMVVLEYHGDTGSVWARMSGAMESARRAVYETMSAQSPEGIAPALVLGVSRDISSETRDAFGRVGIAHVLAVSGLHFGLIAGMCVFLFDRVFRRCPRVMRRWGRRRAAWLAAIPVLVVYLIFVGAPISARRALLMTLMCFMGRMFGRRGDGMRSLAMAALLILVVDPMSVFSVGFQLSFSAVAGILWSLEGYERVVKPRLQGLSGRWQTFVCGVVSMTCMSVGTSLTTAPFVLYHFGQLPIVGVLTNLVVIPFVSFVMMPLSLLTAVFLAFGLPWHEEVAWCCGALERVFAGFAGRFLEHVPLTCVDIAPHVLLSLLSAVFVFGMLYRMDTRRIRLAVAGLSALAWVVGIAVCVACPRWWTAPSGLRVTFVSMGQADATLLEFPDGHVMLVDAGRELGRDADASALRLLPLLRVRGIREIDVLVLTHGDYDHVAGVPAVLDGVKVGEIWHNGLAERPEELVWRESARRHGVALRDVVAERETLEGVRGGVRVEVLWPRTRCVASCDINENSIVLRVAYGAFSVVLMGDAGVSAERAILSVGDILPATVLKVGHHGSKTATSEAWAERVSPKYSVFSVGRGNRYRFPHRTVEHRLWGRSSRLLRTDLDGTVVFETDGSRVHVLVSRR